MVALTDVPGSRKATHPGMEQSVHARCLDGCRDGALEDVALRTWSDGMKRRAQVRYDGELSTAVQDAAVSTTEGADGR